jgi:(S)-2-hydroxyglutarate dehydrogenase
VAQQAVIVGAGIVGLATGMRLVERNPGLRVTILDKEDRIAAHQTSHNSGVVHRGLYYAPGSLKATLSSRGADQLIRFCDRTGVKYEVCGKLVVATDDSELGRLDEIEKRARANGVPGLEAVGPERIAEIEPLAAGIRGLYSPRTAIVDYAEVARALSAELQRAGAEIRLGVRVERLTSSGSRVTIDTTAGPIGADWVVACAGLQSDRLAAASDASLGRRVRIVPFRGHYRVLAPAVAARVHGLIYPVPDPRFPFLGVHLTRRTDGSVWVGPNAFLAFDREGYRGFPINLRDAWSSLAFPGLWRLAARYWRTAASEMWREANHRAFVKDLQRLAPSLGEADLTPGPSGIRAQALARDGSLVDDFSISIAGRVVHVLNAPSPTATASLAIADLIVDRATDSFGPIS